MFCHDVRWVVLVCERGPLGCVWAKDDGTPAGGDLGWPMQAEAEGDTWRQLFYKIVATRALTPLHCSTVVLVFNK